LRLAYVVDVHDRFDAVSEALRSIGEVDILLIGGDITTGGTPEDAERAIALWRPLAPQLYAVAGNMDSSRIDERLADLGVSLNGRGVVLGEIGLAGLSAAPHSPLSTPHELPEDELERRGETALAEVTECRVRIFCPHAPPLGTACDRLRSGEHVGSAAVRALVERRQPDIVLCGHIHESRGTDRIGGAQVANPGPVAAGHYALVEVGDTVSVTLDG
jgi:Icc-related predicted phosphoesterase